MAGNQRRRLTLRILVATLIGSAVFLSLASAQTASVSINTTPAGYQQAIDGFGTCTSAWTNPSLFESLYLDDMYCSMVRVDMSPNYIAPYSNNAYNSPSYGNAGPDGNYVRTYTGVNGAQPYTRSYNGSQAQIATMAAPVMGTNINSNIALLQFNSASMAIAGQLAQLGQGSRLGQLGDFKLFASFWSPPPWVKVTSGNTIGATFANGPAAGAPFPFIWLGGFAGGILDTSGTALTQFNNTSALTQWARTVSASLRGFQNYYGVKFYAISIQNELDFEEFYNSCQYQTSAPYIASVHAVRTELNQYPDLAGIQIEGPEDVLGGDQYGLWEYGNNGTSSERDKNLKFVTDMAASANPSDLAFYSIHGYDANGISSAGAASPTAWNYWANGWTTSPPGIPAPVSGFTHYGKKSWMTESSGETTGWLDSSTSGGFPDSGAFSVALKIYQALTTGAESAWDYWQFYDESEPADSQSLTDSTNQALAPKYVAAKHFFRFIRPNSYRVATTVTGAAAPNILASSFLNTASGYLTVVLINTSASSTPTPVTVAVPSTPSGITYLNAFTSSNGSYWHGSRLGVIGGVVNVSMPAYSVATLTNVPIAQAPTVSVASGAYGSPITLTVTEPNPGVTIYYTTDGSNPTTSATRKAVSSGGTITISRSAQLQFTVLYDGLYSQVTSYIYSIGAGADTPTMPVWGLIILAIALACVSAGRLRRV